jgi:hypothetical protein
MASGHAALDLTEAVSWEAFPRYAERLARLIGATVLPGVDGVDMRMVDLVVQGVPVRLVFSDYPLLVSLEADSDAGDAAIRVIHAQLKQAAG